MTAQFMKSRFLFSRIGIRDLFSKWILMKAFKGMNAYLYRGAA
ncbi:hypothetical protein LEP1GSC060_2311 [Leptospira weilii serovar Ranarum str. ICFT]|uniref:Uncharacterized protein n=1 Tax=Leptospira weilii serovar Ranarum str. ICFT TaxID=1218598 RepID=N1WQ89_9LEPT|nr:hypothetical protein LEP1GSC060_2311 [Leptospira weilii serovar Ranarum str. ICFT]